ncbi:MAG: acyl-CoA desaturase [Phycisphaerales bacterium]|nr:MAG: acyl-CoA desaturase [Phycisphaerales bacterium]
MKEELESASATQRAATLVAVILPFVGLLVAIYGFWGWGFSWVELALLAVMYTATGLGITIGYHRLFTHRAFATVWPVKASLAVLGSMAVQGSILRWVATHRRHHQHSDEQGDPHSPHRFGGGFRGVLAGWWHAHVGWMFLADAKDLGRYAKDVEADRTLRLVSRSFGGWVVLGLVVPAAAGGWITGTWSGALLGFLWGGLVRVFLVQHVTWSINSVCHLWGRRPFRSHDESRNNLLCGVLAFGEGWHNNHHAFPTSARHGLYWWQLDVSFLVIRVLEWTGLAWGVKVPESAAIQSYRATNPS